MYTTTNNLQGRCYFYPPCTDGETEMDRVNELAWGHKAGVNRTGTWTHTSWFPGPHCHGWLSVLTAPSQGGEAAGQVAARTWPWGTEKMGEQRKARGPERCPGGRTGPGGDGALPGCGALLSVSTSRAWNPHEEVLNRAFKTLTLQQ